jgi:predicted  nucleic acid-binding Zn-ribbon protein
MAAATTFKRKKPEIKEAFLELVDEEYKIEEEFEKFWDKIKGKEINMSGIINYLFTNSSNFNENINELLEQNENIKKITTDKLNKFYS